MFDRAYYGAQQAQGADVAGAAKTQAAHTAQKPAVQERARPFNEPEGRLPGTQSTLSAASGECQNPQAPEAQAATGEVQSGVMSSVPGSLPQPPRVSAALAGDGGWALDTGTFRPSQDSEEYY